MADAETTGSVERNELARTISVVGLSISQVADELQQAAERLSVAEERARDIDARVTASEEQLGEQAARVAEMLSLLQRSRDGQIEAEERTREVQQVLQTEQERAERAEREIQDAETRARAAEERLASLEDADTRARALEEQVRELQQADERARAAEERLASLEDSETRARALEEQVRELEDHLEEATTKPNVTVILDDERTAIQEAVAAEVRRPLTSILGITLALKHADARSDDGREMLRQLAANARKLDRLVGEMLDIDRIAAGTFTPNLRRTDIEALVRRVTGESTDLANREVEVETAHIALEVDPGLTEQIVEALLANAGRRTVPGSPVWVTVAPAEGGAVIAVDDMGPEIPAGLRKAMFAAVRQEDPEAGRVRAATGLSLLSRLVEIQGGRCWVEDRPTEGASFRVFLPHVAVRPQEPSAEQDEPDPGSVLVGTDEEAEDEELAV